LAAQREAALRKAEAAAQALAAKEAAAAEKAAAKAAAEAEKLAAKEAADAAKKAAAEAKAQEALAAQEAEPVRVAGPAAIPSSSPKALAEAQGKGKMAPDGPKLGLAENPELANKLAQEKKAAEEEKMKVAPPETRVAYNSYGRRDPFIPVEQGIADNGIDIDQMKVVGIIWQAQEPMAVLEHNRESGVSFTVKQGDPVHNGRVSRITRDQVTFDISEYGISRSYSLKLVSNKEGKKQ
jgi:multidrug efflux pump subunit AcrA (membrane-fusion protein)